jgi:hypothetical protein
VVGAVSSRQHGRGALVLMREGWRPGAGGRAAPMPLSLVQQA